MDHRKSKGVHSRNQNNGTHTRVYRLLCVRVPFVTYKQLLIIISNVGTHTIAFYYVCVVFRLLPTYNYSCVFRFPHGAHRAHHPSTFMASQDIILKVYVPVPVARNAWVSLGSGLYFPSALGNS